MNTLVIFYAKFSSVFPVRRCSHVYLKVLLTCLITSMTDVSITGLKKIDVLVHPSRFVILCSVSPITVL